MAFVDCATGVGVRDDGSPLPVQYGPKRGRLPLAALLATARDASVGRLILTGPRPRAGWLDEPPERGFTADPSGHYVDVDDPCGRFRGPLGRERVEIRRAAAWFGDGSYTPRQARDAMALLVSALRHVGRGECGLMASPAATGQSLWAASLPDDWDGAQLDEETAEVIRGSSPQHRMEVFGTCYDGCDEHVKVPRGKLPGLHYMDGRLMYLACTRERATAPARVLSGKEAARLATVDAHLRARLFVRYTVPAGWDRPGLLMEKHPDGSHWHAPSRPGYTGWTWADSVEVWHAVQNGWDVHYDSGYLLTGRPVLDTWTKRILAMREALAAADVDEETRRLAVAAVRMIALTTIGAFHSRGRTRTIVADGPADVPAGVQWQQRPDGTVVYRMPSQLTGNAAAMAHPELSSQVWAVARWRVTKAMGLVAPQHLVAVWGDALYLTEDPSWPDDGRVGRLRSKGHLDGPLTRPLGLTALLRLRDRLVA